MLNTYIPYVMLFVLVFQGLRLRSVITCNVTKYSRNIVVFWERINISEKPGKKVVIIEVIWALTLYNLKSVFLRNILPPSSILKLETVCSSNSKLPLYQTARRHSAEDYYMSLCHHENLKSNIEKKERAYIFSLTLCVQSRKLCERYCLSLFKTKNYLEAYVTLDFSVSNEGEILMKEIKKAA
jgi:hypothetical protein